MKIIRCDNCNEPMTFIQRLSNTKPTNKQSFGYRRQRFRCDICDISKTVYADGNFDNDVIPYLAKEDVRKMYDQQTKNNE